MKSVTIIGGTNLDIIGSSKNKLISKDSNIGSVRFSSGGVGRNITENLLRLNLPVTFITGISNDPFGRMLKEELQSLGCELIYPNVDSVCGVYLAILDSDKDMMLGLCDNEIIKSLNSVYLEKEKEKLEKCEYLVIDGNLEEDTIEYLFEKYKDKKIIVDGISTNKVKKFIPYLKDIYLLKVNEYEYQVISDSLNKPVYLVVTKGSKCIEVYYLDTVTKIDVIKVDKIVNATGAIYSLANNQDVITGVELGKKLAYQTLLTEDSVWKNKLSD